MDAYRHFLLSLAEADAADLEGEARSYLGVVEEEEHGHEGVEDQLHDLEDARLKSAIKAT